MFLFALAFRMNLPKMFYEYISIRIHTNEQKSWITKRILLEFKNLRIKYCQGKRLFFFFSFIFPIILSLYY